MIQSALRFEYQQELRSWFEVNAKFLSTSPTAYMINSAGLLSQSHLDLSDPSLCFFAFGKKIVDGKNEREQDVQVELRIFL